MRHGRISDVRTEPVYYTSLLKLSAEDIGDRLAAGAEEAARIAYAAAVGGSKVAQVVYGQMLLDGHGVARDLQAACRWFGIAAKAGDIDGINMLGRCHELGWGTVIDLDAARTCYQRAAAKNHHWAQFNLATLMLRDEGTPGAVATALTLLVRSARQGNAKAMNMIGRYREFGWSGPVNIPSAIRWYRRAAERGCFRGAAHFARFMLEQNRIDDAVSWYRRSAECAPVDFCRDLAAHLFKNRRSDLHAVARLALRRAAEGDAAEDLFAYGHALACGRGGPANVSEAAIWLARAQAKGFPGALALLDDISRQHALL
ncbi:tetratricopeptide repeat protein [Pseudorhodoplanes sinuspersici]|uniref:Uncharacterized protein n=1 Tax=Pseudorhodoplanes sinuspersici TaxID=1235591 RepID=A0A1W6ZWB9_9HYPH|nr:tetratricopeptide repeat protein [Pseudorhodoplanes sinuspersici]ARQ01603.1 hypothetical protein CAK95_22720 [Pseudorhodoplanes sinuspersici]RKE73317.1 hypothetical protein DFP91_1202 [Pseudorhodoplanes sinuspersici]